MLGQNIGGFIMQSSSSGYIHFNLALLFVVNLGGYTGRAHFQQSCAVSILRSPLHVFFSVTHFILSLYFFSYNKAVFKIKEHVFIFKVCYITPDDLLLFHAMYCGPVLSFMF